MKFRHEVIDPQPPGAEHDITLLFDVNGNNKKDIVIGAKKGDPNVFWYENPSWERHPLATVPSLEAGGVVLDINGNGRLDFVAGREGKGKELYWFENPEDPTQQWKVHLITDRFERYHDQAIGDIDGDGKPEILISSQNVGVIAYFDIPEDPTVSPWPEECCHVLAEDMPRTEGLVVIDLDGDGLNELVMTRAAVVDIDGDGKLEIVLAEGESNPGRLVWCKPGEWELNLLNDGLFHPHSLEIADFSGDGRPDIFVAEMGLGRNPDPEMMIYVNQGGGEFEKFTVQRGIPTHEAKVADLTGDGKPDIVGKPYQPESHIDVWFNE